MDKTELKELLARFKAGQLAEDELLRALSTAPFADLGYAKPDLSRGLRQGVSEVIYGAGKTAEQIAGIAEALWEAGQRRILITRVDTEKLGELQGLLAPELTEQLAYYELPQLAIVGEKPPATGQGYVLVLCAGTSDLYCAEEAACTAEMLGSRVKRAYDVGVAGLHRLLVHMDDIQGASAIVAVAGMEGALASVVAGLAAAPVIAVPTSVGYGASFEGLAALLAMLNACASGVSVVNIDNGFGAGYQAALIDHTGC